MGSYVVSLDPGGTTGVCLVRNEDQPWQLEVAEFKGQHQRVLREFLSTLEPEIVICETFQNRSQEAASLAPLEYIGIVNAYLQETGKRGIWQSASTGKAFWDDGKLLRTGLYIKALKHARDAIRHYAYWRSFKCNDRTMLNRLNKWHPVPPTVVRLPSPPSS